ncbi:hypothetical protein AB0F91_23345 [Amycolatopsis sp. NPDC023774]|uniref:hypothetical protein n=1 Tax=Amycolatopsis sp. NPDC023774 TaxID=3155015 RepID=UPI0033FBF9D1
MRFLHGHSLREAAAELAITVANAKVLHHRDPRKAAELAQGDLPGAAHRIGVGE